MMSQQGSAFLPDLKLRDLHVKHMGHYAVNVPIFTNLLEWVNAEELNSLRGDGLASNLKVINCRSTSHAGY